MMFGLAGGLRAWRRAMQQVNEYVPEMAGQSQLCSPSIMPVNPGSLCVHPRTIKQRLDEVLAIHDTSSVNMESSLRSLCSYYGTMIPTDRTVFLKTLAQDYNVDHNAVIQLSHQLAPAQERSEAVLLKIEERLRHLLTPRYQLLFSQIGRLERGVKFLVDLRADLIKDLSTSGMDQDNAYLRSMNICLRELLSLWFSVGFLQLERVTWESPCDMLQKISDYEAVHPIRNWNDLKQRVGSYRRCFVFTHKSMPREPVVVLHTALTNEISSSIQSIVQHPRFNADRNSSANGDLHEDNSQINTAIFYSITSTQKGLQGVEMGNYLIKSVVNELLTEFKHMNQFSSLSPVPGFKDWLLGEINKFQHLHNIGEAPQQTLLLEIEVTQLKEALGSLDKPLFEALKKVLQNNSWVNSEFTTRVLQQPLMRLCARYLYQEKRRGYTLNPVAHFHLRNGATMWRINWMADVTPRGLGASCGIMANYRYYMDQTEENSKNYMEHQQIHASQQILDLVNQLPEEDAKIS